MTADVSEPRDEAVEQVARALFSHRYPHLDWDRVVGTRLEWQADARAALSTPYVTGLVRERDEAKQESDEIAAQMEEWVEKCVAERARVARLEAALTEIGDYCSPFHSDGRSWLAQRDFAWSKARAALSSSDAPHND